jgi:hypothetical protein
VLAGCGGGSSGARVTATATQTAPAASVQPAPPVRSMKLTREVPPRVGVVCARTKKEALDVPVACPRLIPAGPMARDPNLSTPIVDFEDPEFWVMTFNNGDIGRTVHWIVGAGSRASVTDQVLSDAHNELPGLPRKVTERRLEGRPVTVYRYPPTGKGGGYNSGHVAAFVDCGDLLVFASVHGFKHADAVTAMALDLAGDPAFDCPG